MQRQVSVAVTTFPPGTAKQVEARSVVPCKCLPATGGELSEFIRIFNPILQGKRFDPEGDYVRHWVPELARVPAKWIHEPWKAPDRALEEARVTLGADYPRPIVDHATARERFLSVAKSHLG